MVLRPLACDTCPLEKVGGVSRPPPKPMMNKQEIISTYRYCQVIKDGEKCKRLAVDLHHCIISRNKRFDAWLRMQDWNFQPTCAICNRITHDADRYENRMAWLHHLIDLYGAETIETALNTAPTKMRAFNRDWQDAWEETQVRKYARTDANQKEIVQALRAVGASVVPTHQLGNGFPDLVVGFRGINYLMEIKDGSKPDSQTRLTPDEQDFIIKWKGEAYVVYSVEDALTLIGAT